MIVEQKTTDNGQAVLAADALRKRKPIAWIGWNEPSQQFMLVGEGGMIYLPRELNAGMAKIANIDLIEPK